MATEYLVQCDLRRVNRQCLMTWLPERFAVVGKWLKLTPEGNGWKVLRTYSRIDARLVQDKERDFLHQREASDV